MSSKIEWTDETWNPATGCTRVSEGCTRCYIERTPPMRMAHRKFDGPHIGATTGVQLHPKRLGEPLSWRKPRLVFVCSMADLFHDEIDADYIASIWAVMACAGRHTFQVLTKRAARMRALLSSPQFQQDVRNYADAIGRDGWDESWPLRNVWVGVSAENQQWADLRIPALLSSPAAVRFVSAEPLLGPIDLTRGLLAPDEFGRGLDWLIVGGESGPGARPMDPSWARSLRDQSTAAGVAFHFKQWGEWAPTGFGLGRFDPPEQLIGSPVDDLGFRQIVRRVGKKKAGRELDGQVWDQFPAVTGGAR
ncbi:phage Gp37/Gp68 family protein [Nocardia sp. CA-290969]|uniref:phage Gp37/Gp68 family protein n=1 Tax=Nocardia sp. CA-290969 TaxID=3239986 RepID=UPI003D8AE760